MGFPLQTQAVVRGLGNTCGIVTCPKRGTAWKNEKDGEKAGKVPLLIRQFQLVTQNGKFDAHAKNMSSKRASRSGSSPYASLVRHIGVPMSWQKGL